MTTSALMMRDRVPRSRRGSIRGKRRCCGRRCCCERREVFEARGESGPIGDETLAILSDGRRCGKACSC